MLTFQVRINGEDLKTGTQDHTKCDNLAYHPVKPSDGLILHNTSDYQDTVYRVEWTGLKWPGEVSMCFFG